MRGPRGLDRRELLRLGLYGIGLGAAQALPILPRWAFASGRAAAATPSDRILVVFEISGGNDGLNTVIPHGDDAYYRHRPKLGIRREALIELDDHFGLNPGMVGFERLYKDGNLAIIHGCGYADPSFSHFSSMSYWHTAAPNSGEKYGWVGRVADHMLPADAPHPIINLDSTQSLAVQIRDNLSVVLDDPERFTRERFFQEGPFFEALGAESSAGNASLQYLDAMARSAKDASVRVRQAWRDYQSPVDYGIAPYDLDKVAALIAADFPTRLYYARVRDNAFDTHVYQADLHERLLTYLSDAVAGFLRDMERIGRADDVVVLLFSEFGRRVPENTNLGTDHGAAGLMFAAGRPVAGGHYGELPSLTELDAGDNLVYTTDFRRVYASVIEGWLGQESAAEVLGAEFETFPMFA